MLVNSIFYRVCSNQSLKLTEPAVDDFAARCGTDLGASNWNVRAMNYFAAAVRRRSLAPAVRRRKQVLTKKTKRVKRIGLQTVIWFFYKRLNFQTMHSLSSSTYQIPKAWYCILKDSF